MKYRAVNDIDQKPTIRQLFVEDLRQDLKIGKKKANLIFNKAVQQFKNMESMKKEEIPTTVYDDYEIAKIIGKKMGRNQKIDEILKELNSIPLTLEK
jgi:hypothetical protein